MYTYSKTLNSQRQDTQRMTVHSRVTISCVKEPRFLQTSGECVAVRQDTQSQKPSLCGNEQEHRVATQSHKHTEYREALSDFGIRQEIVANRVLRK